MAKLALAVAVILSLFALHLARYVPQDLPNTETEILSLVGGEGHKPVAIRLPSEKPPSFEPVELIPMTELPIDGPRAAAATVRPRVVQIEMSFIPLNRPDVTTAGLPLWHPLGHGCRRLRRGPRSGITRLTAAPHLPVGEHRPLRPAIAERVGVDVEQKGEISVKDLVKETETELPLELRHFASFGRAEGEGSEGRGAFTWRFGETHDPLTRRLTYKAAP